jgi:hypothetical protein
MIGEILDHRRSAWCLANSKLHPQKKFHPGPKSAGQTAPKIASCVRCMITLVRVLFCGRAGGLPHWTAANTAKLSATAAPIFRFGVSFMSRNTRCACLVEAVV